jgi:hypothetical protein
LNEDVTRGYEALARGAWEDARVEFQRALARAETPEAYEGLGMAAWWLDDVATTFDAREAAPSATIKPRLIDAERRGSPQPWLGSPLGRRASDLPRLGRASTPAA